MTRRERYGNVENVCGMKWGNRRTPRKALKLPTLPTTITVTLASGDIETRTREPSRPTDRRAIYLVLRRAPGRYRNDW